MSDIIPGCRERTNFITVHILLKDFYLASISVLFLKLNSPLQDDVDFVHNKSE